MYKTLFILNFKYYISELCILMPYAKHLGPVVQSILSLTKSLVNDSFSLLVRLKSSVLIFFAEKMRGAFALQKLLTFFGKKWQCFYV